MIATPYQIDFLQASATLCLMEIGETVAEGPVLFVKQADDRYTPTGAEWSQGRAAGEAQTSLAWTAVRSHASYAAMQAFCLSHAASFPSGKTGTLRVSIPLGEKWDIEQAVLSSSDPLPLMASGGFQTVTAYRATGSEITLHEGMPSPPVMPDLIQLEHRMTNDATGYWFEMGFAVEEELAGNPNAGWTVPSLPGLGIKIERSTDLINWIQDGLEACAGSPEDMLDGSWEYWTRGSVPAWWNAVMLDFHVASARYGKSITEIILKQTPISLPNFPYAMPSQAASLQADLRAAGYTGATVTSSSSALVATAKNHTDGARFVLDVTMSGANVTVVASNGSTISLPSYPYSMPSQLATLQTHLRSAGYSGAVVLLWGDTWEINLPDVVCSAMIRDFKVTFTPDDPYPAWNFYHDYLGELSDNTEKGSVDNLRDPLGNPLVEANRQFFRLKFPITP
jgi:hypothetical protein